MAKSSKPLRERVSGAYLGWIYIIREDDLADELKEDFAILKTMVMEKPPSHWRGAVEETLAVMHWRHVNKCAALIVGMADRADYLVDPKFDYRTAQ